MEDCQEIAGQPRSTADLDVLLTRAERGHAGSMPVALSTPSAIRMTDRDTLDA